MVVGVSTGADLIVCTIYKMLSDSDPAAQASLADVCLTIICNLSPYTKSFGKALSILFLPLYQLLPSSLSMESIHLTCCYTAFLNNGQLRCTGNNAALNLLQLLDRYSKPVAAATKKQTLAMPTPPPAVAMPRLMLLVETLDNLLQ